MTFRKAGPAGASTGESGKGVLRGGFFIEGHERFVAEFVGGAKEGLAPNAKRMLIKGTDDAGNMNPRNVANVPCLATDDT